MIWILAVVILLAGVGWYVLTKRGRHKRVPDAFYVCDVCGERDCDCRRIDPGSDG